MTKHEKAISEHRGGYLVLPLEEKHPVFCAAYDTWYEEKEPLLFDNELDALRCFYWLSAQRLRVRIHPEPAKLGGWNKDDLL